MSNTKAQLTEAQNLRVNELVSQATKGFAARFVEKNNRAPTQGEIVGFVEGAIGNIVKAVTKNTSANDKAKRASDLKAVNELAALNGIKFVHRREQEEEIISSDITLTTDTGYIEENEIAFVNATRGGNTIAFKYSLNEKNELFIDYAVSFCRSDENFDPLIGKQESLKKFLAGDTISTQITHEPFGPVKLGQLASRYKACEVAVKEAQPK